MQKGMQKGMQVLQRHTRRGEKYLNRGTKVLQQMESNVLQRQTLSGIGQERREGIASSGGRGGGGDAGRGWEGGDAGRV